MSQFSELHRIKQGDRILHGLGNGGVQLFDESAEGDILPDVASSKWDMQLGAVPGTYRLKLTNRFLYRTGDSDVGLFDESLNDEERPAIDSSFWNVLPGNEPGTYRFQQKERILYRVGDSDVRLFDESRNGDGRPEPGSADWTVLATDAFEGVTVGEALQNIVKDTAVTPYPAFTGEQATAYQYLIEQFNQRISGPPVADLRIDVYPKPLTYAPSTVFTIVSTIPVPPAETIPPSAWTAVLNQIRREVSSLVNLLDFQTEFSVSANSVSLEWTNRFSTASNTLKSGSGSLNFLAILGALVGLSRLDPDLAPIGVIVGAFISVAQNVAGSKGVSGSLPSLQTRLNRLIEETVSSAQNIYPPIAADWGKLQKFQALADQPDSNPTLSRSAITRLGNDYEISIYQSVTPSTMAIVSFPQADFGSCRGSQKGIGFAYRPSPNGLSGVNAKLCSRLRDIGVDLNEVINRRDGWSRLPLWSCVSTRVGSFCSPRR
jgi:hypothetical protein